MQYLNILSIIIGIANVIIGFIVWLYHPKRLINIIFFTLSIVIAGWIISNAFTYIFNDFLFIDVSGALTYAFSALIIPLFVTFVVFFSTNTKLSFFQKATLVLSWIYGIFFTITSIFTDLVQVRPIIIKPHLVTIEVGLLYPLFFIFFLLLIFLAFILLTGKYRNSFGVEKQKLKYILVGFGVAAFFGTLGNLIVMALTDIPEVQAVSSLVGPMFTLFLVVFTSYAILRFRLFNIRIIIKKGLIKILSFLVIFGIYLFIILSVRQVIDLTIQTSQTIFLIVIILVIALTIESIRRVIYQAIDKVFESRDKQKEQAKQKIFYVSKSRQTVEQIITGVCSALLALYDVENVKFTDCRDPFFSTHKELLHFFREGGRVIIPEELQYRKDESEKYFHLYEELKDVEESAFVSIGDHDFFMGCFAIGKRKNEKAYSIEDVRELKCLQDQFSNALINAKMYQMAIERIKL